MERFIPAGDTYYDPEFPDESDDEEQPLGGWNPTEANPPEEPAPKNPVTTYTEADLYPREPDPECSTEWPLACYWPVYVGNFRLDNLEDEARNAQVANYFASKGLLARMIFFWEPERCDYYLRFLRPTMLLDMLVYFTSKEDAQWAVRMCHRQTYYGHRLNVWPGRTPEMFDASRTIRFQLPKKYCVEKPESVVELILRNKGHAIDTVVRISIAEVLVEFGNEESMRNALRMVEVWVPFTLQKATRKQRFLEPDVRVELMQVVREKAGFIAMMPPQEVLEALLSGTVPVVDRAWENVNKPRALPEQTQAKINLMRKEQKKSLRERQKHGKKRPAEQTGNVLLDGEPVAQKPTTVKQLKGMARNNAARILGTWTRADTVDARLVKLKGKYLDARNALLDELEGQSKQMRKRGGAENEKRKLLEELFYEMLEIELGMMELIPQGRGGLNCPPLELGLAKAVLVAGELLPFPKIPEDQPAPVAYEDATPTFHRSNPTGPILPATVATVRPYSAADLNPSVLDPSCPPGWPLANLWPVYVSNFRANELLGEKRDAQIRQYFAAKGLLATRLFVPEDRKEWKASMLVDMLVYFTSQEDSRKAIELCHRESYYGHRLNVHPGREPVYFEVAGGRTIYVKLAKAVDSQLDSFERDIMRPEVVTSSARFGALDFFYEYATPAEAEPAIVNLLRRRYNSAIELKEQKRKQRFLEAEQSEAILGSVDAGRGQPEPALLGALYVGSVPAGLLNWNWCGWIRPRLWPAREWFMKRLEFARRRYKVLDIWRQMTMIPLD